VSVVEKQWSKYQEALFAFLAEGEGNALVDAKAGSGKTTTIVECVNRLPTSQSVLLVAFNRHIADTLSKRIRRRGVSCMTLNSFGYNVMRTHVPGVVMNEAKSDRLLLNTLDCERESDYFLYKRIRAVVSEVVSLAKGTALDEIAPDDFTFFLDNYDIEMDEDVRWEAYLRAAKVFRLSKLESHCIDFDDQLYLPVALDLPIPQLDWVFVDEVQDLSPIQIELVLRAGKRGRVICVGDYNQAVYGFRGAHPQAVAEITDRLQATRLPLSISSRCPEAVVEVARRVVPDLEWHKPGGVVDVVETREFVERVRPGDMVLCRFTAPLVGLCMQLLGAGKRSCVLGRDIEAGLMRLVKRFDRAKDLPTFWLRLNTYELEAAERYADNPMRLAAVYDRCEALRVIGAKCRTLEELKGKLHALFGEKDAATVVCSTVHKAKGLEADRVWIVKPECLPYLAKASQEWQVQQERNLLYVAVTRAKEELYFVVERNGNER
jgi:DNA helicase-2/ATP-dependent DNA helicase PcrA